MYPALFECYGDTRHFGLVSVGSMGSKFNLIYFLGGGLEYQVAFSLSLLVEWGSKSLWPGLYSCPR